VNIVPLIHFRDINPTACPSVHFYDSFPILRMTIIQWFKKSGLLAAVSQFAARPDRCAHQDDSPRDRYVHPHYVHPHDVQPLERFLRLSNCQTGDPSHLFAFCPVLFLPRYGSAIQTYATAGIPECLRWRGNPFCGKTALT